MKTRDSRRKQKDDIKPSSIFSSPDGVVRRENRLVGEAGQATRESSTPMPHGREVKYEAALVVRPVYVSPRTQNKNGGRVIIRKDEVDELAAAMNKVAIKADEVEDEKAESNTETAAPAANEGPSFLGRYKTSVDSKKGHKVAVKRSERLRSNKKSSE